MLLCVFDSCHVLQRYKHGRSGSRGSKETCNRSGLHSQRVFSVVVSPVQRNRGYCSMIVGGVQREGIEKLLGSHNRTLDQVNKYGWVDGNY